MVNVLIGLIVVVVGIIVIIGVFTLLGKIGEFIFGFKDMMDNAIVFMLLCIAITYVMMTAYLIGGRVMSLLH